MNGTIRKFGLAGTLLLGATAGVSANPVMSSSVNSGSAEQGAIASAMSAAPASVSADATIMSFDATGKMRVLRSGTNSFTCMPDDPSSPGPDPMCADKAAMLWLGAYLAHKSPEPARIGFVYMLQGGSDASNVDPYAKQPADGHWLTTGPHVMIVGADPSFYAAYPSGPDPDATRPYVMWAGTPYQHLMAPLK
jgi:hypothetical protein